MIISKSLRMKIEAKIKKLEELLEYQKAHVDEHDDTSRMPHVLLGGAGIVWKDRSPEEQRNNKKDGISATKDNIELLNKVLAGEINISKKAISDKKLRISAIKKEKEALEAEIEVANRINTILSHS